MFVGGGVGGCLGLCSRLQYEYELREWQLKETSTL